MYWLALVFTSGPIVDVSKSFNVCLGHRKFTQIVDGFIEIVRSGGGRSFAIIILSSVSHAELRGA